jgi:hypothetical protein
MSRQIEYSKISQISKNGLNKQLGFHSAAQRGRLVGKSAFPNCFLLLDDVKLPISQEARAVVL